MGGADLLWQISKLFLKTSLGEDIQKTLTFVKVGGGGVGDTPYQSFGKNKIGKIAPKIANSDEKSLVKCHFFSFFYQNVQSQEFTLRLIPILTRIDQN